MESKQSYDRLIADYLARGRIAPHQLAESDDRESATVSELMVPYLEHVIQYYRMTDGRPTSQVALVKLSLRVLRRQFGDTPAAKFGPLSLLRCQDEFVRSGLSRSEANRRVRLVRQFFRWAVSRELVPGSLIHALDTVEPLRKNRSAARESDPVQPVSDETIDRTIDHLPRDVAAMVELQHWTGMRPQEVTQITTSAIDRSRDVWEYRPVHHKNAHHDIGRVILIGPRGQEILRPWLRPDEPERPLFSPRDRMTVLSIERRAARKSPLTPSQRDRKPKPDRSRPPGDRYTTGSYRRVIHRACQAAGVPKWSPNQIRHSAATRLRSKAGLDVASVVLGHSNPDTTLIYAERDLDVARSAMAQFG
jgi:integrase